MKRAATLIASVLTCCFHASAGYEPLVAPTGQELLAAISLSDVVFVGRLTAVQARTGRCPGSGYATSYQSATYRVARVLMGSVKKPSIVVGHVLVRGAAGLDSQTGCLSPDIFKVGTEFVVLARLTAAATFDFEANEDGAVFPANDDNLEELARVVGDCTTDPRQPEFVTAEPIVPEPLVVEERSAVNRDGFAVDLRDLNGVGLILTNDYFGHLEAGEPDTVVLKSVAISPSGHRASIEISDTDDDSATSVVGFIGKMCPPRILSPAQIPAGDGGTTGRDQATSPVWVSEREIAFLGTSLDVTDAEPWVYLEDIESGRVRSIGVHDAALSLTVKDNRLVCVTEQGEIQLRLMDVQLPAIVAK